MNIQFWSEHFVMNAGLCIQLVLFSFLFFLFITYIISLFKRQRLPKNSVAFPKVSVVIPAYNEEKNILGCLRSIVSSDYDMEALEVVVIDDGSTDDTHKLVESFIKARRGKAPALRLVPGKHRGKSEALNLGLEKTRHALVLSIDADIVLEKDIIKKLVLPFEDPEVAATNAVAAIRTPSRMLEYFQMIEFCMNNLIRTSFSKVFNNSIWFFGAVACYRRDAVESIGGFKKDTLTEDMDICLEMYNAGYRITTVEDARMSTEACRDVKSLFLQRMRWYFGALQSLFKNRKLLAKGKRSPSVVFLFFNQVWWTVFATVFFPMTAYQVYHWFPPAGSAAAETASYLFRWFSLAGPFYVLYKIPEWGLNFLNLFGVLSGVITLLLSLAAIYRFRGNKNLMTLAALFFYFPYTILLNLILLSGLLRYSLSKRRYFMD